jgi:hypothetical protein
VRCGGAAPSRAAAPGRMRWLDAVPGRPLTPGSEIPSSHSVSVSPRWEPDVPTCVSMILRKATPVIARSGRRLVPRHDVARMRTCNSRDDQRARAATLELLDARGVADGLLGTGTTVDRLHVIGGPVLDLRWLPSRFPFMLITPQYHAERLLARRARALGARVVEGVERRCRTPRTSAGSSPRWHTAARPPGAWTATTPSAGRSGAPRCGRAPRCSGWHSPAPRWYVRPVGRSRAP